MKKYIKSNKWNYTLKCGNALRDAIDGGDPAEVLDVLRTAYAELRNAGLIDEDDYERYTENFEIYDLTDYDYSDADDELDYEPDDPEETIDYELDNFYDLCDNLGIWIPLG